MFVGPRGERATMGKWGEREGREVREGGRGTETEGVRKVLVSRNRSLSEIQWRSVSSQIGFKTTISPLSRDIHVS